MSCCSPRYSAAGQTVQGEVYSLFFERVGRLQEISLGQDPFRVQLGEFRLLTCRSFLLLGMKGCMLRFFGPATMFLGFVPRLFSAGLFRKRCIA